MKGIAINIIKLLSDDFPGFVECKFIDAWKKEHTIKEKIPVVTAIELNELSDYPQEGVIACKIIRKRTDADNRLIYTVTIAEPWCIETIEGLSIFELLEEQLIDFSTETDRSIFGNT